MLYLPGPKLFYRQFHTRSFPTGVLRCFATSVPIVAQKQSALLVFDEGV